MPESPELPETVTEGEAASADEPTAGAEPADDAEWARPVDRFRRSSLGTVVAAGLLGVRDALEGRPEREEVTIVSEAPTQPTRDIELVLDPEHPERSVAVIRRRAIAEDDAS